MPSSLLWCGKKTISKNDKGLRRDRGQAFTLEGVISSILLLTVTYTLFQSTIVVSSSLGDDVDAQLRHIGSDTLSILDNPYYYTNETLQNSIASVSPSKPPNNLIQGIEYLLPSNVDYNLEVDYFNVTTQEIDTYKIVDHGYPEDTVSAYRYIVLRNGDLASGSPFLQNGGADPNYPILLEVKLILWQV